MNYQNKINQPVSFISLITGPMFSGKTKTLIEIANFYILQKKRIIILKPKCDERYRKEYVVSHDNDFIEAETFVTCKNFQKISDFIETNIEKLDAIFIDEIHFFDIKISNFLEEICQRKKLIHVWATGLNKGFSDHNLPTMNSLLSQADYILKLNAKCVLCGNVATKTQRIDQDGIPVEPNKIKNFVGDGKVYQARCRNCFEIFSWKIK